ncbi:MAG: AAA family ATPase [Oscillospiraceae bacterium]|jgi:chromosome segregation protein|nr:AAA family ATPase [Oscillospiraceae bacterium]
MYLKALELQGFKSFPEKTRIEFTRPVTSIVGPNGSGKSNISDALSWVMGEQRVKAMRGASMQDVIFSGGANRGAVGFAQVSLVLDNSDMSFPVDGTEVMITRRYYRSGESEYFINKRTVRLKDVNELLMDTGLGRDGYSLIGQGRVDEILSVKSEDRREVFEEAAGISRFRYRKEEAEGKLKHTEENLLRAEDKIAELELQITPLREQAETAKRYLLLRDELRSLEISLWLDQLEKLQARDVALNMEFNQAQETLDSAKSKLETLYANSDEFTRMMREHDVKADEARTDIQQNDSKASAAEREIASYTASLNAENDTAARLEREKGSSRGEERISSLCRRISDAEQGLKEQEKELAAATEELDAAKNQIRGYEMRINSRQKKRDDLLKTRHDAEAEFNAMRSRTAILEDMERQLEGFNRAVRMVVQEARGGRLRGVHGTVADVIRVDSRYALAVEIALGAALQNIIVDHEEDGKSAINFLKQRDAGRATFLPLNTIRGQRLDRQYSGHGIEGVASELAQYDERYGEIIRNLLGRTLIVDTMDTAIELSRNNGGRLRIVTLDGQLINPGGSMTGGSTGKSGGILSRAGEIETLKGKAAKLEETLHKISTELTEAERELGAARFEMDTVLEQQREVRENRVRIEAIYSQAQARIAELQGELHTERLEAKERDAQLDAEIAASKARAQSLISKIEVLSARKQGYTADSAALNEKLQIILAAKLDLEGRRTRSEREAQEANRAIVDAERLFSSIEQKKIQAEMEAKQIADRLWDTYELSRSAAVKLRQDFPDGSAAKATRRVTELKREIAILGVPNIGAIEEFDRVNSRYVYLTEQHNDIQQAKNELLRVIREITAEMEKIFVREFNLINESFKETFLELFGGGRAELILENENDVLNCGVDIKAQPPGKTFRSLSLLSGGERAFVAIALYFAILKIRPTPFCVMDEIESALDEENVRRFINYCGKMSEKTQFVLITHRRGTMEGSDVLFGITMQNGISSVLTLELEKAQKLVER